MLTDPKQHDRPSGISLRRRESMTRLLKLAVAGASCLVLSLVVSNIIPSPWDLLFLIVGATCVPLGAGLIGVAEGVPATFRGPHRVQESVATLLSILVVLASGRILLGIFGWH